VAVPLGLDLFVITGLKRETNPWSLRRDGTRLFIYVIYVNTLWASIGSVKVLLSARLGYVFHICWILDRVRFVCDTSKSCEEG
jgi:hypothetical protein